MCQIIMQLHYQEIYQKDDVNVTRVHTTHQFHPYIDIIQQKDIKKSMILF